jgi:hypothetical protein
LIPGEVSQLVKALDQLGEAPGVFGRGEVAPRKLGRLDRVAEPLASQVQLPSLEPVLAAAYDVDRHRFPQLRDDTPQIPACGVLAVLVDVGGGGRQYADPVSPVDRLLSLLDLGRGDAIRAGENGPEDRSEPVPRVLPDPHERSADARLHKRRCEPGVGVAVGEEATVRQ